MSTRRVALALFALSFAIYVLPLAFDLVYKPFFGYVPGQDVVSTSLLPVSVLTRGDFYLDEHREFFESNWRDPYFVARVNGRLVSRYPAAAAGLALPFYGIPLGSGWITNPPIGWLFYPWSACFAAKFAAAFITALAVVVLFFCLRALADRWTSVALTIAFAFGTSVWSTASQGLWQQTPSILLQSIALWFVLRGQRAGAVALAPAAFFLSFATIVRANNAIAALLFTFYVFLFYRSALSRWILWAIPPLVFALGYNSVYNGSPLVFGYQDGVRSSLGAPRLDGIVGMLISPSRGLLVYSPFFLFAIASVRNWGERRPFYVCAASVCAANILFLSMFEGWDGGWGYGTRLLTDVLPYAILVLAPAFVNPSGLARGSLMATIGFGALLQSFGLWDYGARWHWHWENWQANVWDVARSEPLYYARQYVEMALRFARLR